jgi:hypothetical protein
VYIPEEGMGKKRFFKKVGGMVTNGT